MICRPNDNGRQAGNWATCYCRRKPRVYLRAINFDKSLQLACIVLYIYSALVDTIASGLIFDNLRGNDWYNAQR